MDPFSLTVGISGLVALILQTLKVTRSYFHGAKHARESAAALAKELDVLHSNLLRLGKFLRSESGKGQAFGDTSVLVSSTSACQTKLKILLSKMNVAGESRLSRAMWPLNEKEHQESMQELRAFAQWIQFALTFDGCALLSKTSEDVMDVLWKQLESFQLLKGMDLRTISVERSIKEQTQMLQTDRKALGREKILDWISSFEHEKKHHAVRLPRVEGTGEWLLNTEEFQRWRDGTESQNTLCCYGIQGSGKSVLTSLVIDELRNEFAGQNVAVAFVYFDYRDVDYQSPNDIVASLLKQVAIAKSVIPTSILDIYKRFENQQGRPQLQDLENAFLLTSQEFNQIFLVIDALDECDESKHRRLFIQILSSLRQRQNIRIFITSRSYPQDIKRAFDSASHIAIEASEPDLRRYLSKVIEDSEVVDFIDKDFETEIIERIASGAQKNIQAILSEPTAGEMEEALEAMPRNLHEAFKETIVRIQRQPDGRKRLGMNTLMWISHAKSPLNVQDLSIALAIRSGQTSLNPRYCPSQKAMVECCLGLVTVDEETSRIRLVHYSVQEYFQDQKQEMFPFGEDHIAEMCLTYLFFDSFSRGCSETETGIIARMKQYPFLEYAGSYWGHHVRHSQSDRVEKLAFDFLHSKDRRSFSTQIHQFSRGLRREYWEPEEVNSVNELHVASYFGLEIAAREILKSMEFDIDCATHIGTTPLIRAAASGHVELVRMLLKKKADPTKLNWYGTALHCAAEAGKCGTIKELLKTGMDVDFKDGFGRTALICAICENHIQAVEILLENGADPTSKDEDGMMSIHYAVQRGNQKVLWLLLERQQDLEARTESAGKTILHFAAGAGHLNSLYVLLEAGADIQAKDARGYTALHYAAGRDLEKNVRALLESGVNVNATSDSGMTALSIAVEMGNKNIEQMLLAHQRRELKLALPNQRENTRI